MELAQSGAIDIVLAKKRNRLFRSRLYRLLWDQDLGELGVSLIALDDTGNRFGDAMQDEFAEWEREEISKRTQDGLLEKCRNGLIIKRKRPAYGFRPSEEGNALDVSEPEMEVVRRIFRSVAGGATVYHVRRSLERDGIPAPSGIGRWNHTTIRNIITSGMGVRSRAAAGPRADKGWTRPAHRGREDRRRRGPGEGRGVLVEEDNRGRGRAARLPQARREGPHDGRGAGRGAVGAGRDSGDC
jgi:DNA invertase Pin-like site-specific DNA recombinase